MFFGNASIENSAGYKNQGGKTKQQYLDEDSVEDIL